MRPLTPGPRGLLGRRPHAQGRRGHGETPRSPRSRRLNKDPTRPRVKFAGSGREGGKSTQRLPRPLSLGGLRSEAAGDVRPGTWPPQMPAPLPRPRASPSLHVDPGSANLAATGWGARSSGSRAGRPLSQLARRRRREGRASGDSVHTTGRGRVAVSLQGQRRTAAGFGPVCRPVAGGKVAWLMKETDAPGCSERRVETGAQPHLLGSADESPRSPSRQGYCPPRLRGPP